MSDPLRIALVGATGLVGQQVMHRAVGRSALRLIAIARREVRLPKGARMEMRLCSAEHWHETLAELRPEVAVIALGTTIRAVGGDRAAFRAVDHDLVLATAQAAKTAGVRQIILVSSIGGDRSSRNFYLSPKGEVEDAVARLRFNRCDILRPGLLRGHRTGPKRPLERIGMIIAPLADLLLRGRWQAYRSIRASTLADVILALAGAKAHGRFVHTHADFRRILGR